MKKPLLLIVFQFLFLAGCATNYYVNEDYYTQPKNYEKITVYVTNPDHEAYEVLKKSEIYNLTQDSACPNKLTLTEYEVWKGGCGMPYLGTAMTLGLLPGGAPGMADLTYILESNGTSRLYGHDMFYRDRVSLWETALYPFYHSEKAAQARALALSTRQPCENNSCRQKSQIEKVYRFSSQDYDFEPIITEEQDTSETQPLP
ncbi:MAG: hypothetical protein KDI61_13465 [Alphaproteobacteria bacterium]|nr:hypothetical protein [Alphaproteobacteria bacterium]